MTKLPISTISFNTSNFLRSACVDLLANGFIESYFYIPHEAEKDTTKNHFHLLLKPCKPINPVVLRTRFVEPVRSDRDLGCLPFKPSKLGDWLLYAIHDSLYLQAKGLVRYNFYSLHDIVSNECFEYLEQIYNDEIETYTQNRIRNFLGMMQNGCRFGEILSSGIVPPSQIVFFEKLYKNNMQLISSSKTTKHTTKTIVPFETYDHYSQE